MKLKLLLFTIFSLLVLSCSNNSTSNENFSVTLSGSAGTDSNPLTIKGITQANLKDSYKYSDNSLDPLKITPDSAQISSYSVVSVSGTSKSGLEAMDFIFDGSNRKVGVKKGTIFNPTWGSETSEMATLTVEAKDSQGNSSKFDIKLSLSAK